MCNLASSTRQGFNEHFVRTSVCYLSLSHFTHQQPLFLPPGQNKNHHFITQLIILKLQLGEREATVKHCILPDVTGKQYKGEEVQWGND